MYAKEYERPENDGKQLKFSPFALIWQSRDGKEPEDRHQRRRRSIDLDQPLGLVTSRARTRRCASCTPRSRATSGSATTRGRPTPADDLVIGPLPYVEYDEPTLQVRSESDVMIQDRDMLDHRLRPADPAPAQGRDGARREHSRRVQRGARRRS